MTTRTCPDTRAPRRPRCWECAAKDERIARLEGEVHRLITELIDAAAELAVREGAPDA